MLEPKSRKTGETSQELFFGSDIWFMSSLHFAANLDVDAQQPKPKWGPRNR